MNPQREYPAQRTPCGDQGKTQLAARWQLPSHTTSSIPHPECTHYSHNDGQQQQQQQQQQEAASILASCQVLVW